MAGPTISSAEVSVDLDGRDMAAQARRAAIMAGKAIQGDLAKSARPAAQKWGREFIVGANGELRQVPANAMRAIRMDTVGQMVGSTFARSFNSEVDRRVEVDTSVLNRIERTFGAGGDQAGSAFARHLEARLNLQESLRGAFARLLPDGPAGGAGGRAGLAFMGGFDRALLGRMDRTVAMVVRIVGAAAPQMAALGSALSATVVAALSSALVGVAGGLTAVGAAVSGAVLGLGLLASGWEEAAGAGTRLRGAVDGLTAAWDAQAAALYDRLAPALSSLIDSLGAVVRDSDIGAAMGAAMGQVAAAFEGVLSTPGFQAFVTALETTIPAALAAFGRGLASVSAGLAQLFAAAGPAAVQLGEAFAAWGDRFADAMSRMAASGQLSTFFDAAVASISALMGVVGPLTRALGNVFLIGSESGNRLLGTLGGLAQRFLEFTQSAEGAAQIRQWFAQAEPVFTALLDVIGSVGSTLAQMVTPTVLNQVVSLLGTLSSLVPIVGQVLSAIGQANLIDLFGQALVGVGTAVQGALPLISAIASAIGNLDPSVIQAVAVAFAGWKVIGAFAGPITTVVGVFRTLFTAVRSGLTIMQALTVAFRVLMGAFSASPIGLLVTAISALVAGLVYFFTQTERGRAIVQSATQAITAAWQAVVSWFTGTLVPALQSAWDAIVTGVQAVGSFFATAWQAILDAPQVVVNWFTTTLIPFFASLPERIGAFIMAVAEFFIQLPLRILDALVNLPFQIVEFFSTVFSQVGSAVSTGITTIVTFFAGLPSRIASAVGELAQLLWDWATGAWNRAYDAVVTSVPKIISWVAGVPGRIISAIANLAQMLWTWATGAWNRAYDAVVSTVPKIISWVGGLPGRIISAIANLGSQLWTWAHNAWQEAYDSMSERGQAVVDWVFGLPGRIIGALGDLGSMLWDAGWQIISGLWDGLKAQWENVTGWFSGLGDWIADHKGPIAKDRRLLQPAGRAIMQGLQVGLTSQMPSLARTLAGVSALVAGTNLAAPALAGGGGVGGVQVAGGAGRQVVFQEGAIQVVTPLADPYLVASQVLDQIVVRAGV